MKRNYYNLPRTTEILDIEFNEKAAQKQRVDVISGGYEWTCPSCEELNEPIEIYEYVCCKWCTNVYKTNQAEHAIS